jgi:hypothetical protein
LEEPAETAIDNEASLQPDVAVPTTTTNTNTNVYSPLRTNLFMTPQPNNQSNNNNENNNDNILVVNPVPPKRMYCCSCHVTNRIDPSLTFLKIPKTTINILPKTTDDKRLKYYTEHLRRKLYCQRLAVPITKRDRQYLTFCSLHQLQSECVDVNYKKQDGTRETVSVKVTLPVDVTAPTVPSTRSNKLLISTPPPRSWSCKKKVVDTQDTIATTEDADLVSITFQEDDDNQQHNDDDNDAIVDMSGSVSATVDSEEDVEVEAEVIGVKLPEKKFRLCCFHKCSSRLSTRMTRIPTICNHLPKQYNTHNYKRMFRVARIVYRTECLKRVGVVNYATAGLQQDFRICYKHKMESIYKVIEYTDLKGELQYQKVTMVVPIAYDDKNKPSDRLATGRRSGRGLWKTKIDETKRLSVELLATQLGVSKEEWTTLIMQTLKRKENEIAEKAANSNSSTPMSNNSKKKMKIILDPIKKRQPKFILNKVDDNIINLNTGFPSLSAMLCYIIILYKGNVEEIINHRTSNKLTWFEEWLFFFERLWGRSISRWCDGGYRYGVSEKLLANIFDDKIRLILNTRHVWGLFVTRDEDKKLRLPKWSTGEFHHQRLIIWDNTNVPLCFNPSDAEPQRNTYSLYYGGNVGKGAVFIQPCGWMGTHELYMGAVSDTEYMIKSKVFELQHMFLMKRDLSCVDISWLNMLDKGYRNIGAHAWRQGNQMIVQPAFSKVDQRFGSFDTLRSSSVATIRAGNERAVRNAKVCKFISTGLNANESVTRLCDVWLIWGFQINFMFKPVH